MLSDVRMASIQTGIPLPFARGSASAAHVPGGMRRGCAGLTKRVPSAEAARRREDESVAGRGYHPAPATANPSGALAPLASAAVAALDSGQYC